MASFNEQSDPQAKPAVLQYLGKTAVSNKMVSITSNLVVKFCECIPQLRLCLKDLFTPVIITNICM